MCALPLLPIRSLTACSNSLTKLERTVNPIAARIDDIHGNAGELSERMEGLHQVILALTGDQSPRLPPQKDGSESIISSMELDATGSIKSRNHSLLSSPISPPPRHPNHSLSNSLRFPRAPHRSIADLSPIDTRGAPPISDHPLFRSELQGSDVPSENSSTHRLSSASSDVLGWDQPSIRQQPVNWGTNSDHHQSGNPRFSLNDEDVTMEEAFPERIGRNSIFTASSSRSIAHPWPPPDSSASSVRDRDRSNTNPPPYDPAQARSGYDPRRRTTETASMVVGMDGTGQREASRHPLMLRARSLPGAHDAIAGASEGSLNDKEKDTELATREQQMEFERGAFRNSAILCDVYSPSPSDLLPCLY